MSPILNFKDFKVTNIEFNSSFNATNLDVKFNLDYYTINIDDNIYLHITFKLFNKTFSLIAKSVSLFELSNADADEVLSDEEFIKSLLRISIPYVRSSVSSLLLLSGQADIKIPLFNPDKLLELVKNSKGGVCNDK